MRVYNKFGRRDNIYKARIKILVNDVGQEEFGKQVEQEWLHIKEGILKLGQKEIDHAKSFFIGFFARKSNNIGCKRSNMKVFRKSS